MKEYTYKNTINIILDEFLKKLILLTKQGGTTDE
jgi:hypothetical protein